jgi:hypothetical protein
VGKEREAAGKEGEITGNEGELIFPTNSRQFLAVFSSIVLVSSRQKIYSGCLPRASSMGS